MRRRQSPTGNNDGIFILMSSDAGERKKYDLRRTKNLGGALFTTLLGSFLVAAVCWLASSARWKIGQNGAKSRPSAPKAAVRRRTRVPPTIPRRLIFTYKYNLLAPAANNRAFNPQEPLTANVMHTVEAYQNFWDAMDANSNSTSKGPKEEVEISFLSDNDCLDVLLKAEPRLIDYFNGERRGDFKADICRVAELYLYGGYYFDIDIGVIKPVDFSASYFPSDIPDVIWHVKAKARGELVRPGRDDIVTFATVSNRQGRFFQAFTAAMPGHPVLRKSLDYMVAFYEETLEDVLPQFLIDNIKERNGQIPNRRELHGMSVGPFTLSVAHRATTDEDWEKFAMRVKDDHGYISENKGSSKIPGKKRYSRMLYEISLEDEDIQELGLFKDIPLQDANYTMKIKWCNFICIEGHEVYFYSRVPGSKGCPEERRLYPPYH